MLGLGRKVGESIWIGDDIEVAVLSIRGDTVHLGVRAPKNLAVDRTEVRLSKLRDGEKGRQKP